MNYARLRLYHFSTSQQVLSLVEEILYLKNKLNLSSLNFFENSENQFPLLQLPKNHKQLSPGDWTNYFRNFLYNEYALVLKNKVKINQALHELTSREIISP